MTSPTRDYIWHSEEQAKKFIGDYFTQDKKVLLIGAVGFDPRTFSVYKELHAQAPKILDPKFILEVRELGSATLKTSADNNLQKLETLLGQPPDLYRIPIFAEDRAVIGGREIVKFVKNNLKLDQYTDIVIDISAMSRGIFFPLVLCLREAIAAIGADQSLHVFVIDHPELDYSYLPQYEENPDYMHGFDGGVLRIGEGKQIKLWMPQLAPSRVSVYESLYAFINPTDVCPVMPFPGIKAKRVDELASEFQASMESWSTELHNIFLAAESDPLDMYHTVLRVHNNREELFKGLYNTFTVLSPLGAKVSTIGSMLAAMDLGLPVAYVETAGYQSLHVLPTSDDNGKLVHVWIDGPVYPLDII